jgi:diacylglycerol kinase family enzyme
MCDKPAAIVSLAYLGSGTPNDFSRAFELPNPTIHYSNEAIFGHN